MGTDENKTTGLERSARALRTQGKAMTKNRMNSIINTYRLYELLGTTMPSVDYAVRLHIACLTRPGSSGNLEPDARLRILE